MRRIVRWVAALYIFLSIRYLMAGEYSVGGCINIGGNSNTNCSGNINNSNAASTGHSLSQGEIGGIVVGSIAALINLLTIGATILNPRVKIGRNNQPVWHFHMALLYKFVEGCTLGLLL